MKYKNFNMKENGFAGHLALANAEREMIAFISQP